MRNEELFFLNPIISDSHFEEMGFDEFRKKTEAVDRIERRQFKHCYTSLKSLLDKHQDDDLAAQCESELLFERMRLAHARIYRSQLSYLLRCGT